MEDDANSDNEDRKNQQFHKPARRGRPPLNSSEAPKKEDGRGDNYQEQTTVADNDDQQINKFLKDE
jgi:hypothetical protein